MTPFRSLKLLGTILTWYRTQCAGCGQVYRCRGHAVEENMVQPPIPPAELPAILTDQQEILDAVRREARARRPSSQPPPPPA